MKIGSKYSIKNSLSVEIYDETIFSYLQKFRLNLTKKSFRMSVTGNSCLKHVL